MRNNWRWSEACQAVGRGCDLLLFIFLFYAIFFFFFGAQLTMARLQSQNFHLAWNASKYILTHTHTYFIVVEYLHSSARSSSGYLMLCSLFTFLFHNPRMHLVNCIALGHVFAIPFMHTRFRAL